MAPSLRLIRAGLYENVHITDWFKRKYPCLLRAYTAHSRMLMLRRKNGREDDAARGGGVVMKITSSTDLEFPGLKFAIRQGEVKELPDDPEAAAFILASTYIREVPAPESETTRKHT